MVAIWQPILLVLGDFSTDQVASFKILGTMATKTVTTWRVECQIWFIGFCFKSYSSYKFDWPETIRDQAKMNVASHDVQ